HRLARRPSEIEPLLAAIAAEVVLAAESRFEPGDELRALLARAKRGDEEKDGRFVKAVAKDLLVHGARSVVVVGERCSKAAHALGAALDAGAVETLVVLGGNPLYASPADLELARRFASAERTVYLGLYENETAHACQWFVP